MKAERTREGIPFSFQWGSLKSGWGSLTVIHTARGGGDCAPPGPGPSSVDTTVSKTRLTFCSPGTFWGGVRYSEEEVNGRNAATTWSSDAVRTW